MRDYVRDADALEDVEAPSACYLRSRTSGKIVPLGGAFAAQTLKGDDHFEVTFDYERLRATLPGNYFAQRGDEMWDDVPLPSQVWRYRRLLPITEPTAIISLGEGGTPLVASQRIGKHHNIAGLFFKNESVNPTWSHKDRAQSVSLSMARMLGYRSVVTTSTGNFGAATAAYAARAALRAFVACPPDVSPELLALIQLHGALVVVTDWTGGEAFVRFLANRGWYPGTASGLAAPRNPYGLEGNKTIAYEVYAQLGCVPDVVLVPCASGDTLYGIWKGFDELRMLGETAHVPRMIGCQPSGANALEQTLAAGLAHVTTLKAPTSVATSTREPTNGDQTLAAIRSSDGAAISAEDDAILDAMAFLGREGICAEPASALSVACLGIAREHRLINRDDIVVSLITSAGIKWPTTLAMRTTLPPQIAPTTEALESLLTALGIAVDAPKVTIDETNDNE